MDLNSLKEYLCSVCESFFKGVNIVWVGENSESPTIPLVTLRIDSLSKATFPFDEGFNKLGQFVEYYNADIMFEVKAYTEGYVGNVPDGIVQSAVNTAMNDLQQFADYITSAGMIEKTSADNVSMIQEGPVRDTSLNKSGSRYEYSAMVEYRVYFVFETAGRYAVENVDSNTLLQSIPEEIREETGYFDTVKVKGKLQ